MASLEASIHLELGRGLSELYADMDTYTLNTSPVSACAGVVRRVTFRVAQRQGFKNEVDY